MIAVPTPTQSRPETRVFRVEELLAHARAGRIRVPTFQRGFKWERADVGKLLDSIWRGYPIGTLLLWSKVGPAGQVMVGDLTFEVNEQNQAWFVVDGQQRIVSLVSTLLDRGSRADKFDFDFDLVTGNVVPSARRGEPATHLPLDRVIDSEELLAWVDDNRAALTPEQIRLAFRVGTALREYELPAYVVTIDDERVVREIFERTNSTGKSLDVSDVFNALHTPIDRQPAASLEDLVQRLRVRSLGEIDEDQLLRSLLAIEDRDLAGELQRQLVDVDIPAALERVERAMDRVFGFLAQDAGIPHLRLLPYQGPLTVLSAFFNTFPTPSTRARRLLTRWLWRGTATGELRGDGKDMRPALEAVRSGAGDEVTARGILATVSTRRPDIKPSEQFNLRYARSRLSVIALFDLRPHDLRTGEPIDVVSLLNGHDDIVPPIVTHRPASLSAAETAAFSSVGNRLLYSSHGEVSVLTMLVAAARAQAEFPSITTSIPPHVLASHAILAPAMQALYDDDLVAFVELRRDQIDGATARLVDRHAEWNHSDRLSIAALSHEEE